MAHPSPDDCASCRRIFGELVEHELTTAPGTSLPAAVLAERVGLVPRVLRRHLTELVTAGRIDVDRRTPLPGASVGRARGLPDRYTLLSGLIRLPDVPEEWADLPWA
ncbi:hypothetical protein, partial [Streptomyces kronopolitis]